MTKFSWKSADFPFVLFLFIRMHDLHAYTCNPMTPVYETMEHGNVQTLIIMLIKNDIPKFLANRGDNFCQQISVSGMCRKKYSESTLYQKQTLS